MSDEDPNDYFGPLNDSYGADAKKLERILAISEARAKAVRQEARTCAKCGKSMFNWPGRTVHYSCDPKTPLAGLRCTCAPDCSDTHWGNGNTDCDAECVPCKINRGHPLRKRGRG